MFNISYKDNNLRLLTWSFEPFPGNDPYVKDAKVYPF